MALMMLTGHSWKVHPGRPLQQAVGAVSGILIGATGTGSPPMVLYLTGRGPAKERLRGTRAVFFPWGDLVALVAPAASAFFSIGLAVRPLVVSAAPVTAEFLLNQASS